MKRLMLICLLVVVAVPAALPSQAQDSETEAKIANALSALPAPLAREAAVFDYPADGSTDWIELRPGSNGWTCFPDWPATPGNDPQCNDARWMKWMEAYIGGTDPDISTLGLAYMLQGGSDPSATDASALEPAPGDDWVTSPPHVMILSPTTLDPNDFSTDPGSGEPWLMFAGTPYEHIMMPVQLAQAAGAPATPSTLPVTGAQAGFAPAALIVLAGLGLTGGAWIVSRRQRHVRR